MIKLIIVLFFVMSISLLSAELVVDIPFDLNIVGDSFAANGAYQYQSEWITVTNTGTETQSYTFMYTYENLPSGWDCNVCNTSSCLLPNFPASLELEAGASEQYHILVSVSSTAGFAFTFTFAEGDIVEPLIYNFTFDTEDNVNAEDNLVIPRKLFQNYPNPFNPTTTISFSLTAKDAKNAKIEIYNLKGQKVKTFLINQSTNLPVYQIVWNGTDENNQLIPSGIYYYKLNSDTFVETKKMILMK